MFLNLKYNYKREEEIDTTEQKYKAKTHYSIVKADELKLKYFIPGNVAFVFNISIDRTGSSRGAQVDLNLAVDLKTERV